MRTYYSQPDYGPWHHQDLFLFHGTHEIAVEGIKKEKRFRLGRASSDFGSGLYTTTNEKQARGWAHTSALRYQADNGGALPEAFVIKLELEREVLAKISTLYFVVANRDFWRFVNHCRKGGRHKPDGHYDVAAGPLTQYPRP